MHLAVDDAELKSLVNEVVEQTLSALGWPTGRVALTEAEAAQACGVKRHVLRDARLRGELAGRRVGKGILYTPDDLRSFLDRAREETG